MRERGQSVVGVCACDGERERERECVCVCVYVHVCMCLSVWVCARMSVKNYLRAIRKKTLTEGEARKFITI